MATAFTSQVHPTGSRNWVQRLMIQGRRRELGLGGFPLVSLAEARAKAFAYRKVAREGGDPLTEKRRADGIPTFAEAARTGLEGQEPRLAPSSACSGLDVELEGGTYSRTSATCPSAT